MGRACAATAPPSRACLMDTHGLSQCVLEQTSEGVRKCWKSLVVLARIRVKGVFYRFRNRSLRGLVTLGSGAGALLVAREVLQVEYKRPRLPPPLPFFFKPDRGLDSCRSCSPGSTSHLERFRTQHFTGCHGSFLSSTHLADFSARGFCFQFRP
ncbi:hypothetical protein HDK77DRAFT_201211 [Phyllosticta capitalensis]